MKKKILALLMLACSAGCQVYAGTCTSDTYTANSANTVLTSTKYNGDHSTIYDRLAGSLDAGCLVDGTLEDGALNTTDYAALLNGVRDGCAISWSDAATISMGDCIMSVNGNFVKTTTANTVTWGCTGCSAEAASTDYYVYVKTGSTGTTLTGLITTTAPDPDGYDSSGNKILGRFFNDGSSDINQNTVKSWANGVYKAPYGAGLLASVTWAETTNCQWIGSGTSWTNFPDDDDCGDTARTCYGGVNATDCAADGGTTGTDGAKIKIVMSFIPAGTVRCFLTGMISVSTAGDQGIRFYDGTTGASAVVQYDGSAADNGVGILTGEFTYATDQTNVTIQVQQNVSAGTANISQTVSGRKSGQNLSCYYFPHIYN